MLSPRYLDDGKALLYLSEVQREAKARLEARIASGEYRFETGPCLICQGEEFQPLSGKDRCGLRTPVVICRGCGLVQTNPHLDQESYAAFYRSDYRLLQDRESTPEQAFVRERHRGQELIRFLESQGYPLGDGGLRRVYEVGCGAGGILGAFRERGCEVLGADLASSRFGYGRSQGVELRDGGLEALEGEPAPDLLLYSHVLEHILDPRAELAAVHRFLGAAGLLYLEVPGVYSLAAVYEGDFLRYLQNVHVFHFTLQSLRNLLHGAGFQELCGDEHVRSLWRPGAATAEVAWESDFAATMEYLEAAEKNRPRLGPRQLLRRLAMASGLFPWLRGLRDRLGRGR